MNYYFKNKKAMLLFALPGLLLYTTFVIFPLIPELLISFQKHNGISSSGYVGFENFKWVLTNPRFWIGNKNILIVMAFSTFVGLPISLILAIMLDFQGKKVRRFFRTASFIPAVLAVTVISQIWIGIYNPQWGLVNTVLRGLGLENWSHAWLTNQDTALICVAIVFVWQYVGFNMVLFYAGLKSIPKTYYEAALIDGAGPIRSTIKITIPLLQDIIKYVLIISVLGCMGLFVHVKMLTSGGPGDASMTVIYLLFNTSFKDMEFGRGSAIAILFLAECVLVAGLINRFVAREKIEF
ncbi:MAG: sugar ABC transporter permease [Clostridiales bacterium]|nr:sugar ABC transporter permease [Clostridiales bacterium]